MATVIDETQLPYATSPDANTVMLFDYTGRGIISHALTESDGAGAVFLAVALPNEDNPNFTFAKVYRRGAGEVWPGTQIGTLTPTWKIDHVHISHDGTALVVSANTHEPKEAPRHSQVEAYVIPGVWSPVGAPGQADPPEPCVPPGNLPYFRPNKPVTRAQVAKMIAVAAQLPTNDPTHQSFQDIPVGSTFHLFIEALKDAGAVGGYPCVP